MYTAVLFGVFFTTVSLFDLSSMLYAIAGSSLQNLQTGAYSHAQLFYVVYRHFRMHAPYLHMLELALSSLIILALIGCALDLVHMFTRKANAVRNACDVITSAALCYLLYITFTYMVPLYHQVDELYGTERSAALLMTFLMRLQPYQWQVVGINVLLLIVPFVKYAAQQRMDAAMQKELRATPAVAIKKEGKKQH